MKPQPALALLELDSIPHGILTADALLKEAPVAVLKTGTVHNGKYLILIGGSVAAVETAFRKGLSKAEAHLLDSVFLPNIHGQVYAACLGERHSCGTEALSIMETATVAASIQGADAALKGAQVDLVELRLADGLGGKSIALYAGEVAEVETAVMLAESVLEKAELLLNRVIIPRIDPDLAGQISATTWFTRSEISNLEQGE